VLVCLSQEEIKSRPLVDAKINAWWTSGDSIAEP